MVEKGERLVEQEVKKEKVKRTEEELKRSRITLLLFSPLQNKLSPPGQNMLLELELPNIILSSRRNVKISPVRIF